MTQLSRQRSEISKFATSSLISLVCYHFLISKTRRTAIAPSNRETFSPIELLHTDLLGPMKPSPFGGRKYALGIMDGYSAKSDVYYLTNKDVSYDCIKTYQNESKKATGQLLQYIRLDGAGENRSRLIKRL